MRIVYLDLDALTPSHLSCYGYHRKTSPTIDQIAAEGVRCTNTYCSDAPCLPSRTAFYQGRFGISTGVVGHGGTAADPKREGAGRGFKSCYETESFPFQLQKQGFHTAMISPFGQRHAAHQFYAGFHEIHNTGKSGTEIAYEVQPVIDRWLGEHAAEDNWYLHINYWDIHTPYRTPLEYENPFEDEPVADWFTDDVLKRHMAKVGPHSANDLGMYDKNDSSQFPRIPERITDRASLKKWMDGYDIAIRYVDDQIAKLVQALKDAGVYEDTAIIISADHGENQGEMGIYGEHGTADHATCNIPFIVKWPGGKSGHVDHGLHYHLDWAPTCMELLGHPDNHPATWDGQSFAPVIREGADAGRDELILSQCCHVCQRSVRFDKWLYIRTYHDGFHLFPRDMLFDLEADPHEQHNVADENPNVLREATWRMMAWHDERMHRMTHMASDSTDPLWTVMRENGPMHARRSARPRPGGPRPAWMDGQPRSVRDYIKHVEATGRAEGAEELRRRYAHAVEAEAGGA